MPKDLRVTGASCDVLCFCISGGATLQEYVGLLAFSYVKRGQASLVVAIDLHLHVGDRSCYYNLPAGSSLRALGHGIFGSESCQLPCRKHGVIQIGIVIQASSVH